MAMLFEVTYPSGEQTYGIGYPGTTIVVNQVPPGPESCMYDELEVVPVPGSSTSVRVVRIVGGPRRPTYRVRVLGGETVRNAWMDVRDAEGWTTLDGHDPDPDVVWVVALEDDLDPATLGEIIPR
ncbi:MAG: hypothetical protein ACKV2T_09435 [Kofleriaceae bacterium]